MHELAVAAVAAGHEVELRGEVSLPVLEELAGGAGARPQLPPEGRLPRAGEIVVIPEGGEDPLRFARYVLSPARLVIAVLAPPGQFGWPFVSPWSAEPHLSVDLDRLARPEHFRAMADLDVDLWTHMPVIAERARAAGARCELIGSGEPVPLALSHARALKDVPVAYLQASRWLELARDVAARLEVPARMIPGGPHEAVLAEIARAQILLLPARVEGDGRLLREARALGTVVVGLSSQIYAVGLQESCGAVAVETLGEMPGAVEGLLADPGRMASLAQAGRTSATAQVEWGGYVRRVDAAIRATAGREPRPRAAAMAELGARIGELAKDRQGAIERVAELDERLAEASVRVAELDAALAGAGARVRELDGELARAREVLSRPPPAPRRRPLSMRLRRGSDATG